MTITNEPTALIVKIGDSAQTLVVGTRGVVSCEQLPLNGRLGPVTLEMLGKVTTGPAISRTLPATGCVRPLCLATTWTVAADYTDR